MQRRWVAGGRPGMRSLLALVLTISMVTAACGDDDDPPQAGDDGESTAGTLELDPATTTTTTPEDRALSQLLPEASPLPGFERADDVLGAGALDLDRAAAAEGDVAGERALLESEGFVRGASRGWVDAAQDVVYLALYEFDSAEGAAAYLDESVVRLEGRESTPFEVPGVEGARGFTTVEESPQGDFTGHAVTFTRGERWVLALVGSPGSSRSQDDARAVAAAQAALLA